jgi:hypothetical protein
MRSMRSMRGEFTSAMGALFEATSRPVSHCRKRQRETASWRHARFHVRRDGGLRDPIKPQISLSLGPPILLHCPRTSFLRDHCNWLSERGLQDGTTLEELIPALLAIWKLGNVRKESVACHLEIGWCTKRLSVSIGGRSLGSWSNMKGLCVAGHLEVR